MFIKQACKRFVSDDASAFEKLLQEIKTNSTIDKSDPLIKLLFNFEHRNKLTHQELQNSNYKKWDYSGDINYNDPDWKDTVLKMVANKYKVNTGDIGERMTNSFNKASTYKQKQLYKSVDDVSFKDLYAERFTPIGSFEKMESLADQRIEYYFKNNKNRKQENHKELTLNNNPYVERTEFHLNNMLKTQNCKPLWIDNQKIIDLKIKSFKKKIKEAYLQRLKIHIARNKLSVSDIENSLYKKILETIKQDFDRELELINFKIRDYNLSLLQVSPSLSQLNKWKLSWEMLFVEVTDGIDIKSLLTSNEEEFKKIKREDTVSDNFKKKPWYYIF
ncbi:hypothetical protein QEN19_000352 [Hanseniaspora menglaensis]